MMFRNHVLQEDEKAAVAADSKVASRFAYNQLVNEGEAAGSKGPGAKRGKDGHVQLSSGDDFFSAPLSTSGRKASGRCAWWCSPRWLAHSSRASTADSGRPVMASCARQSVIVNAWVEPGCEI